MKSIATIGTLALAGLMAAAPALAQDQAASEPTDQSDEMEATTDQVPAPTIDSDSDGTPDAWDRDGDGQPDQADNDGDGKPDA